ncbi:MAG: hypothetical protein JO246_14190 [Frankiaceae bacterium]|nr:hypothetical protein [Frankiaceae bacterium]MBV9872585.1 hypothetical protein [Frankiaceae bacterium]
MHIAYASALGQPAEVVWTSLTDVDSVLAALPGAALARDGDGGVTGSVKCKLNGTQITYRVTVQAQLADANFRTTVLTIAGKEARGSGTLDATLTVAVRDNPDAQLEVSGDIAATGRGEAAEAEAWRRVIELMVHALVPPTASSAEPAAPVRPPLAVAPPLPASSPASSPQRPMVIGLMAIAFLLVFRRIRRRRTAE